MSALLVAAVVVLVIVLGVYVATRGLPQPWTPPTTCAADSDCPHPETCDSASHTCGDPALPGLLTAAQSAAQQYYTAIQSALFNLQNVYAAHASTLVTSAAAIGLNAPSLTPLAADLATGVKNISRYVQQILAVPGCSQAGSTSCGYWTEIMPLTPRSAAATIWSTGSHGQVVAAELPVATQAFPPVASDLEDIVNAISADQLAKLMHYDGATWAALNVVKADIAQINGYEAALTALAAAVKQTGFALYSHFIN